MQMSTEPHKREDMTEWRKNGAEPYRRLKQSNSGVRGKASAGSGAEPQRGKFGAASLKDLLSREGFKDWFGNQCLC